jgi:hypothetical protein
VSTVQPVPGRREGLHLRAEPGGTNTGAQRLQAGTLRRVEGSRWRLGSSKHGLYPYGDENPSSGAVGSRPTFEATGGASDTCGPTLA